MIKLNSSRCSTLLLNNLFSFSLIPVLSNEGWSVQVELGLCVYRSPIYHNNTKFASFFKVSTKEPNYPGKCLCGLMAPHLQPAGQPFQRIRFNTTGPKIHTKVLDDVSGFLIWFFLCIIILLLYQDKSLFPNSNENDNPNQNRSQTYLTLRPQMQEVLEPQSPFAFSVVNYLFVVHTYSIKSPWVSKIGILIIL